MGIKTRHSFVALLAVIATSIPGQALMSAEAATTTTCGISNAIYGVSGTADLREWIDAAPATPGAVTLVAAAQRPNMGGLRALIAGGSGVLYGITTTGQLLWFRHLGSANGQATWDIKSGSVIGKGWAGFTKVVADGRGTLYGVSVTGELRWYRHTGFLTGGATYAAGAGAIVGYGWNIFKQLVSGGLGTLYGTDVTGKLRWYHHDGWLTGRVSWQSGSGGTVGTGWAFPQLLSAGGGVLLGVNADGSVRWYNHLGGLDGAFRWATGSGTVLAGIDLSGITNVTADPGACSSLDANDLTAVRSFAAGMVHGRGLATTEFTCLNNVVVKESSWRWNAGTVAGAYGIPQALPGSKMLSSGADWQTSPVTQINWMLDYIAGRYSTPCGAWAFWQTHNYY